MRGPGAGYTRKLVHGERAPPGFSLDDLAPDQIEKIEIVRAATAEYQLRVAGTYLPADPYPTLSRYRDDTGESETWGRVPGARRLQVSQERSCDRPVAVGSQRDMSESVRRWSASHLLSSPYSPYDDCSPIQE